jgi:iron(III) transport system ATP-binding protein
VRDDTLHVLQTEEIATLIVTHDADEAMFMADRIALLHEGRIVQSGPPEELYLRPASEFVAEFLGEVNRAAATVRGGEAETPFGRLPAALPDGPARVLVRPEGLRLMDPRANEGLPAAVEACRTLGPTTMVHLVPEGGGAHLHARLPPGARFARGDAVRVGLDPARAFVFPA